MRTLDETKLGKRYVPGESGPPPPFRSILCGIDGSRASQEAARQAAALAAPGAEVDFVCVRWAQGVGLGAQATIADRRAEEALELALTTVEGAGASATTALVRARDPFGELLERSRAADLLVLGSPPGSRAGGIALGQVGSRLLHEASVPVLVSRSPDPGHPFPGSLLIATDGSEGSAHATRLAAQIARRHASSVIQLHVGDSPTVARHLMAAEAAALMDATGAEPVGMLDGGTPHLRIVECARSHGTSLVVLGSRGLHGLRALGSVSERVAHEAPCSVLVARPPER